MPKSKKKTTKKKIKEPEEPIHIQGEFVRISPVSYKSLQNNAADVPFVLEVHNPEIVMFMSMKTETVRELAIQMLIACDKFEQYAENQILKAVSKYRAPATNPQLYS